MVATDADWTVVLRDGAPAAWQRAAEVVLAALAPSRWTSTDITRAVRGGNGFVDLLMTQGEAQQVSTALEGAGFGARALARRECEPADPPMRLVRLDFSQPTVTEGFPWAQVHVIHTVLAQPAPFFLPPDVNASTKVLGAAMTGLHRGAQLVGGGDLADAALGLGRMVDALRTPISPASGPPELVVELLGLWQPRVQVPVDFFQYDSLPTPPPPGRRHRLITLLRFVCQRAPNGRAAGFTEKALAGAPADQLKMTPTAEHKRLISAWLTTRRLWPDAAR